MNITDSVWNKKERIRLKQQIESLQNKHAFKTLLSFDDTSNKHCSQHYYYFTIFQDIIII
jgi:hypothetical protein